MKCDNQNQIGFPSFHREKYILKTKQCLPCILPNGVFLSSSPPPPDPSLKAKFINNFTS